MASLKDTAVTGTLSVSGALTAPTAPAGTNTTQVATTAFVSTAMGGGIPSGVITLWKGSTTSIPAGWYLCNGQNGTPNLQDRFVVGAGSGYAVGATGGATSASVSGTTGATTLTTSQMPSHTHSTITVYRSDKYSSPSGTSDTWPITSAQSGATGGGGSHTHSMGGSVDTRPPYYALCYIMKA